MHGKFHSDIQNKVAGNNDTAPPHERDYKKENSIYLFFLFIFLIIFFLIVIFIIIIIIIIVIVIELIHSKAILEITLEIEPQPAALDF